MIKPIILLLVLGVSGCDREAQENAAARSAADSGTIPAATDRVSQPPAVVPKPKDQAQLDRMILAGFTPHADHLHPPGVNKCPLIKGSEAVM